MSYELVMPQLGLSMDSGEIVEWVKNSGDPVKTGDILFIVESDKANVEVEAVADGFLQIIHDQSSGPIPVGDLVGYILAEGEQPQPVPEKASLSETDGGMPVAADTAPSRPELRPDRPPSSPAARRRAGELGLDWRQATGTGPAGRIKVRDVEALAGTTPATEVIKISPLAQRLIDTFELDVTELAAQYPGSRIERDHVEAAVRQALRQGRPATSAGGGSPPRREPMGSLRTKIARHMVRSHQENAPVTLTTEAEATELVKIRRQFKEDGEAQFVPSYNSLLAKLVGRALVEHPALNVSLDGEEILYHQAVNMGIAVDTARGLIVPVVRNVQARPLGELVAEMEELLPRAAAGKARPDELRGSTFTLTNLGKYEIDYFTPLINPPECAILGVGRLVEKIIPVEGQPAVRTVLALSLTFDHRLVDGGPAARFLQRIKQFIERPYLWLV